MRGDFSCTIRSSDGVSYAGNVRSVALPTPSGEVQVLAGHAESYIALAPGRMVTTDVEGRPSEFAVAGGIFHIKDDVATVIL